jgi:SynChlorMet cassette radical SAM/SPASM protein ScmF
MQKEAIVPNGTLDNSGERTYPLESIYFYLTEGCNLRCRHCWIEPKFQGGEKKYPTLDIHLFRSILSQGKPLGLSNVKLTGGEPLLHPQIGEIIDIVGEEKLNPTIETNAVLCTSDLARRIAACGQPFVSVSLDGADSQTHEWVRGVKGSFDDTLRGIRNLVEAGIQPQVIMTLMRRNVAQMESLVRMAESIGASSVKFNVVQPTARGEKIHISGETVDIEELVRLGNWVENDLARRVKIPLYYSHPLAFRPLGYLFGEKGNCAVCAILSILGVLSDGRYALCGIGTTVPELIFGHAAEDSLSDVWQNAPVLQELREGLPRRFDGICGDCVMKGICLGGCIAQNYYRDRRLWAGYWFCEEAWAKGLFPESRIKKILQKQDSAVAGINVVAGKAAPSIAIA